MATRFGGAQVPQYASPAGGMRPGFMRMPSNGGPPAGPGSMPPNAGGQGYGGGGPGVNQQRQPNGSGPPNGAAAQRRPERKDTKETAWVHWRALKDFLTEWGDKESPTARASAREKLTRLTRLQFLELSTDVYDELMRRKGVNLPDAMPFLPVRDDFHPKRNQARQKLATLPKNRFKDLASDVFFELHRRYPEFEEGDAGGVTSPVKEKHDNSLNGGYEGAGGPAQGAQQQQQQQHRPTHHQKGSSVGSSTERSVTTPVNTQATRDRFANLTTATNDVVVPNKSRLQEEAIEVPYARDSQDMGAGPSESLQTTGAGPSGLREGFRPDSRSSHGPSSNSHGVRSPSLNEQNQYMDRMSVVSNSQGQGSGQQSKGAVAGVMSSNDWNDMEEKLRSEYELRIAGLERRVHAAESEHEDTKRQLQEERERRKDYEDEVRGLKERATTHASSLRSIQHELDVAKDGAENVRKQSEQTSRQAQEEIAQWRERCEDLEDELHRLEGERTERSAPEAVAPVPIPSGSSANDQMVDELRSEVRSLVEELRNVSLQNDELMAERERERETHAALEDKVEEYKKMANAARVELRNLKATSTLFVSKPLSNDHLPASPDGNIDDIHVAEFQAAIDELLTTTRSSKPTQVLPCMKAVVEAVTHIGDDVKTFQEAPNFDVDVSRLEMLKHESTARLSALMTEARNHAMASGLSPLSLMDAAASHLSINVVEIIKLLKIRRSGSTQEIMSGKQGGMRIGDMVRRKSGIYGQSPVAEEEEEPEQLRDETPLPGDRRPSHEDYRAGSASSFNRALDNSTSTAGYNRSGEDAYSRGHQEDQRGGYGGGYGGVYKAGVSASSPIRGGNLAAAHPPSAYDNPGLPEFRIKSFQSASSTAQRSDAFDLERKGSSASARSDYEPPHRRGQGVAGAHDPYAEPYGRSNSAAAGSSMANVHGGPHSPENQRRAGGHSRGPSLLSPTSPDARGAPPFNNAPYGNKAAAPARQGGSDQEWKDLQPYLSTQSPLLVGAIQNLLTDIRTGGQGPTLNDHLSEVIAISSSIVGVCRSSLPQSLRARGEPHLKDLVDNTDRLSDAQATAAHAGGFDKELRTKIASASFGVAKGLKALMKVGGMNEQQQ